MSSRNDGRLSLLCPWGLRVLSLSSSFTYLNRKMMYLTAFPRSHLNLFPLYFPNCKMYSPVTSRQSDTSPPLWKTSVRAFVLTISWLWGRDLSWSRGFFLIFMASSEGPCFRWPNGLFLKDTLILPGKKLAYLFIFPVHNQTQWLLYSNNCNLTVVAVTHAKWAIQTDISNVLVLNLLITNMP